MAGFAATLFAVAFALAGLRASASGADVESFDFVVVGGGLAGCVLANRLSASGQHSVLLLSVSGAPPSAYSGPVVVSDEFIVAHNASNTYGMSCRIKQPGYEPVPHFSTDKTGSSPARWLGGSSLVALTLYLRDHPEALNAWGKGWGWKDLQPYFHRAEGALDSASQHYGHAGPYTVRTKPAFVHPLTRQFVKAASNQGNLTVVDDLNAHPDEAVGVTPVNQHSDGTKVNAYDVYLRPALKRPNLVVRHGVRADRLVIKDKKVVHGVAFRDLAAGTDHVVHARKEVVLAAGYVYTPKLLFQSGIGNKHDLEAVGLRVVRDLPAVGQHLTAARYSPLSWNTSVPTLSQMLGSPISPEGSVANPESYQSCVVEAHARFRSSRSGRHARRPDVVVGFLPLYYAPKSAPLQYSLQGEPWPLTTNAYTLLVTLGETEAKGSVTFPSASPDVSPEVTHDPLTKADLAVAAEAVAWARKVGGAADFRQPTSPVENGAGGPNFWSAVYDGRGTCRMGSSDRHSVVDFELKVHGLKGVRIADGSVIPHASPYLAVPEVLAVAERAAEMLLQEHGGRFEQDGPSSGPAEPGRLSVTELSAVLGKAWPLMTGVNYLAGTAPEQLRSQAAPSQPQVAAVPVLLLALVAGALITAGILQIAVGKASGAAGTERLLA